MSPLSGHLRAEKISDEAGSGNGPGAGVDLALRFDSMGFYQDDGAIAPQFPPGMPLIGAFHHWLGEPWSTGITNLAWAALSQ
ncbi:hypothetical protein [Nonomuraea dietziae]|uniref:hypothetical protein n=1 Tax=Nonomuraea dietziae TaxID=65515 RepID=UPI0033F7FFB2